MRKGQGPTKMRPLPFLSALVAQRQRHRLQVPKDVGSNPTWGTEEK